MEDDFSSDSSDEGISLSSDSGDSDLIFSSSSDNEEANEIQEENNVQEQDVLWPIVARLLHGRPRQKVENYVQVVQNKSDDEFRATFRVTRQLFQQLLGTSSNALFCILTVSHFVTLFYVFFQRNWRIVDEFRLTQVAGPRKVLKSAYS